MLVQNWSLVDADVVCSPLTAADLVGFTAWSSMREPASVFILLETLFRAFDKIAAKRMVYKVETIGDCYGKS